MRKLMYFFITFFVVCIPTTNAQVRVYDYPDTLVYTSNLGRNFKSDIYNVKVIQGEDQYESYVLADYNTFPNAARSKMTEWNHSTTFSFSGSVQIEISKKDGSNIVSCKVYPVAKEIPFSIIDNKKVVIDLDEPQYMYIELYGMKEHPLFIFADPPEENIPEPDGGDVELISPDMSATDVRNIIGTTNKSTIYFEKGIHNYGEETDNTYPGYQLPIVSDKTYYIPGGAYVIGSFNGTGASNTTFRGRGIISTCGKERLANAESIPYNLIMFNGNGTNQLVDGLTFTNPAHFVLLSRGEIKTIRCKMFGWWHQTDGWGGENGSSLYDSFIKVNDDFVKVYRQDQIINNLVIYKQINGAAFQLGWNSYGSARNCHVSDIYVVKDDEKIPGTPSNTAVISLVNNDGSDIIDVTFENIYIENDVQRTVGIKMNGGYMNLIKIRKIFHTGKNNAKNYLYTENGGVINSLTFDSIFINGNCIDSHEEFNMDTRGTLNYVGYVPCSTVDIQEQNKEKSNSSIQITNFKNDHIEVNINEDILKVSSYEIYDITGKSVKHGTIFNNSKTIYFSNKGIFLFVLRSDDNILTQKFFN